MLNAPTVTAVLALASGASAQQANFSEGFDGAFENIWNTFPFASFNVDDAPFVFLDGFPSGTFEAVGNDNVFRMTNAVFDLSYFGMSPEYVLNDPIGRIIEMRINTLGGPLGNSTGPVTLRVLSPSGNSVTIGLFDGTGGTGPLIRTGSTITGDLSTVPIGWAPNTWYRLQLDNTKAALRAKLLNDQGTPIYSRTFPFNLADLQVGGLELRLAVLQDGFVTSTPVLADMAIDWLEVRQGCPADLVAPFGIVDLADIDAFIAAFLAGSPEADLALPVGVLDQGDVDAFITSFFAGCP
ncbi:MAG: GC-type dockerin domain-anchored protein [Planctomycetota bacterium]